MVERDGKGRNARKGETEGRERGGRARLGFSHASPAAHAVWLNTQNSA